MVLKPLRMLLALTMIISLLGGTFAQSATPAALAMPSADLVISQIYGGGGNSGATYTHDYIELFNRGTAPASIAGWSVQYTSPTGTGTFGSSATAISELPSVSIAPGKYYLIQEASNAAVGAPLPTPDLIDATPIPMGGTAGKVILVNTTAPVACNGGSVACSPAQLAQIVDLVGFGTANFFEGSAAAPAPSNTTADFRKSGGCVETDQNGSDFEVLTPAARNGATPANICGGGNNPVASCPATLVTTTGQAALAPVRATDANARIISATLSVTPPTAAITLAAFVPSPSAGVSATASLNVLPAAAPGSYSALITFSNDENPVATATCTVAITVNPIVTNQPIVPNCPATLSTAQGTATAAGLSARDADGTVITATITSAAVPGISLVFFTPAAGVGLTATATLNVANTVAAGTYNVTVRWANDDAPTPQTATCAIAVTVTGAVRIRDIQGAGHISPRNGQTVTGVPGIVTARTGTGFYIQDPTPDANVNTSEGILVYTNSAPAANIVVGAAVSVNGTVTEFRSAAVVGLTLTEIANPTTTVISTGNPLPAATVIGQGGRVQPTVVIDNDSNGDVETSPTHVFDPAQDGIDFYETLEGMVVQVNSPVVSGPTNNFGEFWVLPDNGANASIRTTRGGIVLSPGDFNPERVLIDDAALGSSPQVKVNDKFGGPIVGVMDYAFSNFRIQRTNAVTVVDGGLQRESAATPTASQITVAAFNVENLDPGDTTFPAMADMIVNRLKSPDVLALQEIQDNNGETNDSNTDASQTYAALINAIRTAGGPTYQFRDIAPQDDQDGGAPGGNIRVGYLFRTDRGVSFIDRPGGTSTAATTVQTDAFGAYPSFSPGRIDPTNTAWNSSRKPLVAEFSFRGQRVIIINNHFNSKGGDQPLFGHTQPPVLSSETQRRNQAQAVNTFVDSLLAADANAKILVMGDLNDFQFSNPLFILKDRVLSDLVETLPEAERYTYVFDGNAQALDHILASRSITTTVPFAYDVIHANSEFPDQISDHEPEILHLTVNPRVLNLSASSATVGEGAGTATLTVTLSAASVTPVTVGVRSSNGTATAGSDYTAISTTLTFAPGQTSRTVTVPIIDDTAAEGNETFNVTLSNASGATIGTTASVVTIVDNDSAPTITLNTQTISVNEATGVATVTVVLAGSAAGPVTVQYATANGTATAGSDYTAANGTLTFAQGETTKTFTVSILRDAVREPNETFNVTLSNATGGATIGTPGAATVTIIDGTLALYLPLISKP